MKGGVPQGTKLGVILFIVMTNKLLWEWNLRTKFVDDTSVRTGDYSKKFH